MIATAKEEEEAEIHHLPTLMSVIRKENWMTLTDT